MIDLGTVKPGSTIRIPFSSFDKDDGSSITMTNYAAADILIYKDGGTTERASTAGFTATTDFDSKTGKHVAVIDLADNTTSGFFNAGSEYLVAIDSVTVDTVTTGAWIARFRIGYPNAVLDTTIATLTNQTSFTLTAGPAEDDALNGLWAIIHDVASAVQCSWVEVLDYTGSTKTVTLAAGATFTAAAGDNISLMGPSPLRAATTGRTAAVGTAGQIDANVTQNGGTNITATGGRQEVNLSHWRGTQPATLADTDKVPASVQHMANNVMTAAAAAADLTTELQSGLATAAALATAQADLDTLTGADGAIIASGTQTFNMTGNITGNLSGSVGSVTGAVGSVTGNVGGNVAGSVGSVTGAVGSVTGNVGGNVTGSVGSVAAEVTIDAASKTGHRLSATGLADIRDIQLVEGYAADGAAPTLNQAVFGILQFLTERSISSTTLTVKRLDGSTTAMTFTLDDANSPTSITRAS